MIDRLELAEKLLKRPRRVLLVDDDDLLRESLAMGFQDSQKVEMTGAPHGEEAIRRISDGEEFDCIMLDLNLGSGHMDGVQVFEHIKNMKRDLPVAFFTGWPEDERLLRAQRSGLWFSIVPKSVDLDELENMICSLVKRNHVDAGG